MKRTGRIEMKKRVKALIIPLTQNQVAIVDLEDYKMLSQHEWCLHKNNKQIYAARNHSKKNGTSIYMHRQVLGIEDSTIMVKHKNRNTLDNRKENLYILRSLPPKKNMDVSLFF